MYISEFVMSLFYKENTYTSLLNSCTPQMETDDELSDPSQLFLSSEEQRVSTALDEKCSPVLFFFFFFLYLH